MPIGIKMPGRFFKNYDNNLLGSAGGGRKINISHPGARNPRYAPENMSHIMYSQLPLRRPPALATLFEKTQRVSPTRELTVYVI